MNKLTVIKGMDKYEISIDDYKIIYGHNYEMKFDILRTILRYANNSKLSEYALEHNNIANLLLNDKNINTKRMFAFHVHYHYSISDDFKLTSKSLVSKYLEILLQSDQFFDTINTINILYQSLSDELSISSNITGQFNTMVPKQLLKLLTPLYIHGDFSKDDYDLSFEEIIVFQLNLLKYIVNYNHTADYNIFIIEIPYLSDKIYDLIKQLKNCHILIFVEHLPKCCHDINKYVFCENKFLDIADENKFYEMICDNSFRLLMLKEGREYMEKYIIYRDTDSKRFIMRLLNM
jgi:hypothetical protein